MNAQLHAIGESTSANTFSFMQNWANRSVRIFIIKYGRSTHWKVLLTTDTSMNFVRAFELYERRWGIESYLRNAVVILDWGNVRVGTTTLRLQTPPCVS